MAFDTAEMRKNHTLMYHWNVVDSAVSIIISVIDMKKLKYFDYFYFDLIFDNEYY